MGVLQRLSCSQMMHITRCIELSYDELKYANAVGQKRNTLAYSRIAYHR